jgi:chromosome segregation ATPase
MDLKERIKVALGINEEATEVKLAFQAKLVDGTIITSEADEMAVGVLVSILSEDGETTPMPEGTYELEDGTKFTVDAEGLVTEIADVEEEVEEEVDADHKDDEDYKEDKEEMAIEDKEAALFAEVGSVVKELLEEVRKDIARLSGELDELRGENLAKDENLAELQEENTNLAAQVKELNEAPATESVNLSKFAENKKVELSADDYNKLTPKQKYLHNLNKLK